MIEITVLFAVILTIGSFTMRTYKLIIVFIIQYIDGLLEENNKIIIVINICLLHWETIKKFNFRKILKIFFVTIIFIMSNLI